MPKKREVASFVGNFSPVKRRRAILVNNMRHLRGDTGDVLKTRAVVRRQQAANCIQRVASWRTLLEDRGAVHLDDGTIILVLFVVTHCRRFMPSRLVHTAAMAGDLVEIQLRGSWLQSEARGIYSKESELAAPTTRPFLTPHSSDVKISESLERVQL